MFEWRQDRLSAARLRLRVWLTTNSLSRYGVMWDPPSSAFPGMSSISVGHHDQRHLAFNLFDLAVSIFATQVVVDKIIQHRKALPLGIHSSSLQSTSVALCPSRDPPRRRGHNDTSADARHGRTEALLVPRGVGRAEDLRSDRAAHLSVTIHEAWGKEIRPSLF